MAEDYDNTDEIRNLSDEELRAHVRAELASRNGFDSDDIELTVRDGAVTLSGRVGTEEELRIVEHVLTDVIGIEEVTNNLVVDELRRAVSPEAIDEHLADEEQHSGLLLGDVPRQFSAESAHLADVGSSDPEGTRDLQEAMEEGEPWTPPESPTPEGIGGSEQSPGAQNAEH